MQDPELRRLKEIERLARDRFLRLGLPGTFGGDAEVIKAAEDLWTEAAAAVRAHRVKWRGLSEPTAATHTLHFDTPFADRPTFDAAEPRPIKDFILFRCRAVFHAAQASQAENGPSDDAGSLTYLDGGERSQASPGAAASYVEPA
jgi:hypothetical protein